MANEFKKRYQSTDRKCGIEVNGSNQITKYKIQRSKWVKIGNKIKMWLMSSKKYTKVRTENVKKGKWVKSNTKI